ncbi:MAG: hypothetical protein JWO80_5593 [Bryobacterales bacterium]|nr:hypothetical protein [Bryobacterales bacterium]
MASSNVLNDDFTIAVKAACTRARQDTLKADVSVFYRDEKENTDVMEQPDGRKFEIRFLTGAPRDRNYQVLRELGKTAA